MAEAGRIKHHLKHNLWRPEAHVVMVGYQAVGTLGRRILEGAQRVRIFGEEIVVRAKVHDVTGLSAHADRDQLLDWAAGLDPPKLALLTHGEPQAAFALQRVLRERLRWSVEVPSKGQTFALEAGQAAQEPPA
jgi:metallo-beta-lactamase family protein